MLLDSSLAGFPGAGAPPGSEVKLRGFILWFVGIVVVVGILSMGKVTTGQLKSIVREVFAPVQQMAAGGVRKTRENLSAVRDIGDVMLQNERLEAELVELRNELLTLKALEQENIQLRDQLLYEEQSPRELISCEVIARDITGWWQSIRLGKGDLDGIRPDMAVITPSGLMGKTVASSPRTSDVLLVSDPNCRVSVQIARTGTYGVLSGMGVPEDDRVVCQMNFVSKRAKIQQDDKVVTSGLGGIFPKGLMLGSVESVALDGMGLAQQARVVVRSDLSDLTHAFVVVETEDPVGELLRKRAEEAKVE